MTSALAERSAARPRICNVPPCVSSSGLEAVDLARSAGLVLDPWQADALVDALGERADGKWSAFEVAIIVARQQGKGAILEARELAGLFLLGEQLILHSAHEYKTAMEAFRRVLALIEGTRDLSREVKKVVNTNGEEGIELRNGARLRFMARSKGSGRGFSADLVIWDEAYALTEAQVEAQLPTLSARPNPQVWYTSSPPLDPVSGAVLMRVHERGLAGDNTLCYLDWGAERGVDLDDREVWARTNPAYPGRIAEETIVRERAAMSDEGFGRERLCIWPATKADQWAVIGEVEWEAAKDKKSEMAGVPAFAVEMSIDRKTACIAAAGRRADGLRHVEMVDARSGPAWLVGRVVDLVAKWQPCAVVIHPGGPAGSLIPDLEAAGVELVKMTEREVAQAAGAFRDGLCGLRENPDDPDPRNIRHIGQPLLTIAVAGAVRRDLGNAFTWDHKAAVVDTSPIAAAANALWGHSVYGHQVPQQFFGSWR